MKDSIFKEWESLDYPAFEKVFEDHLKQINHGVKYQKMRSALVIPLKDSEGKNKLHFLNFSYPFNNFFQLRDPILMSEQPKYLRNILIHDEDKIVAIYKKSIELFDLQNGNSKIYECPIGDNSRINNCCTIDDKIIVSSRGNGIFSTHINETLFEKITIESDEYTINEKDIIGDVQDYNGRLFFATNSYVIESVLEDSVLEDSELEYPALEELELQKSKLRKSEIQASKSNRTNIKVINKYKIPEGNIVRFALIPYNGNINNINHSNNIDYQNKPIVVARTNNNTYRCIDETVKDINTSENQRSILEINNSGKHIPILKADNIRGNYKVIMNGGNELAIATYNQDSEMFESNFIINAQQNFRIDDLITDFMGGIFFLSYSGSEKKEFDWNMNRLSNIDGENITRYNIQEFENTKYPISNMLIYSYRNNRGSI